MDLSKETAKKIEELQLLEAHLQNFLAQAQLIQVELNEILNAISELENSKDDEVYKIFYGMMVKSSKEVVLKELKEKNRINEVKVSSVEKQQQITEKNISKLREEVNNAIVSKKK